MTPDGCLIVLFAVFTVAAYLLWITERLPGVRKLLGLLAIASLLLAVVLHDIEMARIASDDREVTPPAAPAAPPPADPGAGA